MRLTIVGLGVLGTSLGMALKAATSEIPITGHDPEPSLVSRAKRLDAIDRSHWNLPAACEGADFIVLDLPMTEMEKTLVAICQVVKAGAVIVGTCAVTAPALALADRLLPSEVHYIGGHVVGAGLGLGAPEPSAGLLRGANFHLVISKGVSEDAAQTAHDFAEAVGTTPRYVDGVENDGLTAAAAQLPTMVALALANAVSESCGERDRREFIGGEMMGVGATLYANGGERAAELVENRERLLPWLDRFAEELGRVRDLLASGDQEALAQALDRAAEVAGTWGQRGEEEKSGSRAGYGSAFFGRLFLGGLARDRNQEKE